MEEVRLGSADAPNPSTAIIPEPPGSPHHLPRRTRSSNLCALTETELLHLEARVWQPDRGRELRSCAIEELVPGLWKRSLPGAISIFDQIPEPLIQWILIAAVVISEYVLICCSDRWLYSNLVFLPCILFSVTCHLTGVRFLRTPRWLRDLMDLPSEEQCAVQIRVVGGVWPSRRVVGIDYGIITFTDDVMHFEGRRTAFDLPNRVVSFNPLRSKGSYSKSIDKGSDPYVFEWWVGDERGKVEIRVYKSISGSRVNYRDWFRAEVAKWMAAPALPHKTITLPPFPRERKGA